MADVRRRFVSEHRAPQLINVGKYAFDPDVVRGNIECFAGVAQGADWFCGTVAGEWRTRAGRVLCALATTEGTLVSSYSRGMKLLREAGGVTVTVIDDAMQRAPVFVFGTRAARVNSAFGARTFRRDQSGSRIDNVCRKTPRYRAVRSGKIRWLRFNFTTGDAAGQNLVTKATQKACEWILTQIEGLEYFALAANMDTDKKHSSLEHVAYPRQTSRCRSHDTRRFARANHAHTRKETAFSAAALEHGRVPFRRVNNGSHFANGITALFIATGQDVANVAESSAGFVYGEVTPDGDYYFSVTIPSLIVATYGGGTGLPTQKECLEVLGCYGKGKVNKLAEIVAATVLSGELSLGSAIVANEWSQATRNSEGTGPKPPWQFTRDQGDLTGFLTVIARNLRLTNSRLSICNIDGAHVRRFSAGAPNARSDSAISILISGL